MNRQDLIIAGIAVLVTAASWSAAIAYDAGQRAADSYTAGQRWAEHHHPSAADCEMEMFRISGPEIISGSWLDGCLASPATTH